MGKMADLALVMELYWLPMLIGIVKLLLQLASYF
jgi:hypothetical protein